MIYLVEFEGLAPGVSTATTFRFSSGTGYVTSPTDTPPDTVYPARILDPGTYERQIWTPGATRGRGSVGLGVVELANADGALDHFFDFAFDGRAIRILRGDERGPRTAFSTVLRGTLEHVAVTSDRATLRIRDRQAEVAAMPLVSVRYAGDNVLPDGAEGTAADLKGMAKPVLWGEAENVQPPRVNSSRLIYQLSSRALASLVGVYEGGNAITAGVNRGTLAALQATAPSAGTYDYSLGNDGTGEGAYIRLGSSPSLTITATAYEGAAGTRTAGQTMRRILTAAGISADDTAALAAFDGKNAAPLGWWQGTDETTVGAVLDLLAESVGAGWVTDRSGAFQLYRLEDPAAATPVATFAEWQDLGGVQVTPTGDDDRGIPSYEVALGWGRNFTVLSGNTVAGAVAAARKDWLALESRTAVARNTAIWDPTTKTGRHPLSTPLSLDSLLRIEADAQAEAARLLGLYSTRRRYVVLTVAASQATAVDIGTVIALDIPRLGLGGGKRMLVVGLREELGANRTTIFCWS